MKSAFLSILLLGATTCACTQIQITTDHLPNEGDVLIQQNVMSNPQVDVELTGPNTTWDYSDYFTPVGAPTAIECISISETPFTFQLFFNNFLDPEHDSDFANGIDQLDLAGMFTVEDAYLYYQNRDDRYALTGLAASLNSIPLGAQSTPVDVIYELPLNYQDESSSFSEINFEIPTLFAYRLQQTRTTSVDGWGTLTLNGASYDVIRVRSEIQATDSIYIEQVGTGFTIPRPVAVEYKWLSQDFIVPVLQVNTNGGVTTTTQTADIFTSIPEINTKLDWTFYPNPCITSFQIKGHFDSHTMVNVSDLQGRIVYSNQALNTTTIDCASWNSGIYFVSVSNGLVSETQKLLIP